MRIGIDISSAIKRPPSGIGNFILGLVQGLKNVSPDEMRFDLCIRLSRLKYLRPGLTPKHKRFHYKIIQEPLNWLYPRRIDLFHGPDARLPSYDGCALVATFHDVFSMLGRDFMNDGFRDMKKARYHDICTRANLLFAVSQSTKNDIVKLIGVSPGRIHVVPEAASPDFHPQQNDAVEMVRRKFNINERYLIFVGQISRRKNVTRIVKAYKQIRKNAPYPVKLVVVGKPTYGCEEALIAMEEPGVKDGVIRIHSCIKADLIRLYSGAEALLFPTLYEGFGLPVLEAMSCGTPVVTSNLSSLPEVAGDAAFLVDPEKEDEIADRTLAFLHDKALALEYRDRGLKRAEKYTWEKTAEKTLEGYMAALSTTRK